MKQYIATSISQSERIIAAGISPDTADMCWKPQRFKPGTKSLTVRKPLNEGEIPAWSLSALLTLIPVNEFSLHVLNTKIGYTYYQIRNSDASRYPFPRRHSVPSPIEACVQTIESLAKRYQTK